MYEAELEQAPNDADVKASLMLHLYRLGFLYYDAIETRFMREPLGSNGYDSMGKANAESAENACQYMHRSFQIMPNGGAASVMADVFKMAGFYATAIHWLRQAEEWPDKPETATKAKAKRLDMQADEKTSDSVIGYSRAFPTRDTPGLVLENQPAQAPTPPPMPTPAPTVQTSNHKATSQSGGCGGKAAVFFIVLYALAHLIR